jgi:hypothetical protein
MTPEEIAAAAAEKLAAEQEVERLAAEVEAQRIKDEEDEEVNKKPKTPEEELEAIVEERLAKMKANMDKMATERDDLLKDKATTEKAAKEASIARMKEEGKVQEALELELAEARARLDVYATETKELKRDGVLNDALSGMEFRNEKSRDMARREIVDQLVQNEDGSWSHSGGTSIRDYTAAYAKDEDNSFLFRTKSNTGGGKGNDNGDIDTTTTKSIMDMSTQEILAQAAKGKLGNYSV